MAVKFNHRDLLNRLQIRKLCLKLVSLEQKLLIPYKYVSDVQQGIRFVLNERVGIISHQLGGIMLSYGKVFYEKIGLSYENGFICRIVTESVIFQPKNDEIVLAHIHEKEKTHINCLILDFFNISIIKQRLCIWNDDMLEIGQEVEVRLLKVVFGASMLTMRGEIISVTGNLHSLKNVQNSTLPILTEGKTGDWLDERYAPCSTALAESSINEMSKDVQDHLGCTTYHSKMESSSSVTIRCTSKRKLSPQTSSIKTKLFCLDSIDGNESIKFCQMAAEPCSVSAIDDKHKDLSYIKEANNIEPGNVISNLGRNNIHPQARESDATIFKPFNKQKSLAASEVPVDVGSICNNPDLSLPDNSEVRGHSIRSKKKHKSHEKDVDSFHSVQLVKLMRSEKLHQSAIDCGEKVKSKLLKHNGNKHERNDSCETGSEMINKKSKKKKSKKKVKDYF